MGHGEHWGDSPTPTVFSLNEPIGHLFAVTVHRHYPVRNSAYRFFYNSLIEKLNFYKIINDPYTFEDLIDSVRYSKEGYLATESIDDDIRITLDREANDYISSVYIKSKGYQYDGLLDVIDKSGGYNHWVGKERNEEPIDPDMYEIISNAKYYSHDAKPNEEKKVKEYLSRYGFDDKWGDIE